MQPSLVVTDIDGTLLPDNGIISSFTGRSLTYLNNQLGIPVVLATGRPPRDVLEIVAQLDFNPLCICANGAVIYNSQRQDLEFMDALSEEDIRHCILEISAVLPAAGFAIEPPHLDAAFYGDQQYTHPYSGNPPVTVISERAQLYRSSLKLLISFLHCPSHILAEQVEKATNYAYEVSYFYTVGLVEIAKKGVNKATGLAHLASRYALATEHVIAFGDMNNDIEIIQSVWRGVAMANASRELHAITPYHTLSNNEDGIAHELSKFWPELKEFQS